MPLVATELDVRYHKGPLVLRAVNLTATPGRVTAVLGPNAAGKTTLLCALGGLIAPAAGRVELDGTPIARVPHRVRAGRVALVAQRPAAAFGFTLAQVVAFGRYAAGDSQLASRRAALDALKRVGLAHAADTRFDALSEGQRQRGALARAFAQLAGSAEPAVILADEPLAAQDPAESVRVSGLLRDFARGGGAAVVVLHDLTAAARLADDVVLLDAGGRVHASGPAAQTLVPETLQAVYSVGFSASGAGADRVVLPVAGAGPVMMP